MDLERLSSCAGTQGWYLLAAQQLLLSATGGQHLVGVEDAFGVQHGFETLH